LTTTDLAEGSNLYYTNVRADARITVQKGATNGIAELDGSGKVPVAQLTLSSTVFKGSWDANTNTPTITSGVGTTGDYYIVSVAGSTLIDGISTWGVGDQIIFNGTAWDKIPSTSTVTSVAGKTGVVTLQLADITDLADTDDLPEGSTNLYYTETRVNANTNVGLNTTHRGLTNNPHSVTSGDVGLGSLVNILSKYNATAPPTANDDASDTSGNGVFAIGSSWVDLTNDQVYVCVDSTATAAVWNNLSSGAGGGEANTASSVGGTSVFKAKVSEDLEFKGLTASSSLIALSDNANDIGIDVNQSNITGTGALDTGTITSGFGSIDTGASSITTTGLVTAGNLVIDNVGIDGSLITFSGPDTSNELRVPFNLPSAFVLSDGVANYLSVDSTSGSPQLNILQDTSFSSTIQFSDMSEPVSGADGTGLLYKLTGDDGLWWKPDSGGSAVDLSHSGDQDFQTASSVITTTTTSSSYVDLDSMTLTTSNTSAREYFVSFSAHVKTDGSDRGYIIVNVNGVDIAESERHQYIRHSGSTRRWGMSTIAKTGPLGNGVVIKIRWQIPGSDNLSCDHRTLIIQGIKL
jgi:hypothetical protein